MSFDTFIDELKNRLNDFMHNDWAGTLIITLAFLIITALVSHIVTLFLRKVLQSKRGPIPSASIFVNIGRITIWAIGISIILSTCFGINIQAAVTALGIGGIAISLGFQQTLANMIGGIQVILAGIVEPGDRIKLSSYEGVVRDITWRHTTITTAQGETVIIPNSVISTEALVKLPPEKDIRINIVITEQDEPLSTLVPKLEKAIDDAVSEITMIEEYTQITVLSKSERGYNALVSLVTIEGVRRSRIVDAILKAVSGSAMKGKGFTAPPANDRRVKDLDSTGSLKKVEGGPIKRLEERAEERSEKRAEEKTKEKEHAEKHSDDQQDSDHKAGKKEDKGER